MAGAEESGGGRTQQKRRKPACRLYRRGSRFLATTLMTERPGKRAKKLRISVSVRIVRSASLRLIRYSKSRGRATSEAIVSSRASTMLNPAHITCRGLRMTYTSGLVRTF